MSIPEHPEPIFKTWDSSSSFTDRKRSPNWQVVYVFATCIVCRDSNATPRANAPRTKQRIQWANMACLHTLSDEHPLPRWNCKEAIPTDLAHDGGRIYASRAVQACDLPDVWKLKLLLLHRIIVDPALHGPVLHLFCQRTPSAPQPLSPSAPSAPLATKNYKHIIFLYFCKYEKMNVLLCIFL